MKVSQIITAVDVVRKYRNKIASCHNALNWELMQSGETQKAEWIRKELKESEEALGKFLDEEV